MDKAHTVLEWLNLLPKDTYVYVKSYNQVYSSCNAKTHLEEIKYGGEEENKKLSAKVYNVEVMGDYVVLDTHVVCWGCGYKDRIIDDLWSNLYMTDENIEKLDCLYREYENEQKSLQQDDNTWVKRQYELRAIYKMWRNEL